MKTRLGTPSPLPRVGRDDVPIDGVQLCPVD
jgi:hypothetical protein